jgi:hypothetical protein
MLALPGLSAFAQSSNAASGSKIKVRDGSDSVQLAIQKVGVDPCTLLTDAEVKSALGQVPVPKRKVETLTAPAADCDWENDLSILGIRVEGPGSAKSFDKLLDKDRTEPVAGVGDKARWNKQFGSLDFIKGDRLYTLQLVGPAKNLSLSTSLARAVLSRM